MKKLAVLMLCVSMVLNLTACGTEKAAGASIEQTVTVADLGSLSKEESAAKLGKGNGTNDSYEEITDTLVVIETENSQGDENQETQATQDIVLPEIMESISWSSKTGDFVLNVVGAENFTDEDGCDAVRVYYDFYHNGGYTAGLEDVLSDVIFEQDGTELDKTYESDEIPDVENRLRNLRPGTAIRCIDEYALVSEGVVSVSITVQNDEKSVMSFDLDPANLPGKPLYELEYVKVTDPQWIASWPSDGEYHGGYYVTIKDTELVEDVYGNKALRVYFEFANNAEEAECMGYAVYETCAFQDGIQLLEAVATTYAEEEGKFWTDVEPGESIVTAMTFALNSDSPVEIEVHDPWADGGIGMIVTID